MHQMPGKLRSLQQSVHTIQPDFFMGQDRLPVRRLRQQKRVPGMPRGVRDQSGRQDVQIALIPVQKYPGCLLGRARSLRSGQNPVQKRLHKNQHRVLRRNHPQLRALRLHREVQSAGVP